MRALTVDPGPATTMGSPGSGSTQDLGAHPGWPRRLWNLPLGAHLAVLAVVLLAVVPVVGTRASFSADEGAAIVQARSLARGDGWIVEHPVPGIDPEGAHYPLELSGRGPKGVAPFAKHPLYAVLLAGADRLGGTTAMVLLSLLGTVAAAAVAAALAGRLGPGLARPVLWAVGLASPLLFDGFVVIAHTLGAALAAGAVLAAVVALERRSRRSSFVLTAAVAVLTFTAVLLRTEAFLFAGALAAAVAAWELLNRVRTRSSWRSSLVGGAVAAASVVGGAGAVLAERAWARAIVGATPASTGGGPVDDAGFLAGRVKAFLLTWARPGYDGGPVVALLLLMVVALGASVLVARRRPGDAGAVRLVSALAAGAGVLALVVEPNNLVPGLLVAFPLAAAGLAASSRDGLRPPAGAVSLATFALFALAVAATQYTSGGSGEWGGRYFALGLPILVPVLVAALAQVRARIVDAGARRWWAGSLVACSAVTAVMGLSSLRSTRQFTADLMAGIDRMGATAATAGTEPVIVTDEPSIPRLAWATFDRQRWLLVKTAEIDDFVDRLGRAGTGRVVVVTAGPDRAKALSPEAARTVSVDTELDRVGWQVAVVAPI